MKDAEQLKAISNVHPYLQHQLERTMEAVARSFKFVVGSEIRHVKSGGVYVVMGTPNEYVIEATREAAYAYLMPDGRICVRSQTEMEDGRFEEAEEGAALAWINTPGNYEAWLEKAGPTAEECKPTPDSWLVESTITFDEFIEYGKALPGTNIVNGMPWSFMYKNHPVTHCDDNKYAVGAPDGTVIFFRRGESLIEVLGQLGVCKTEVTG